MTSAKEVASTIEEYESKLNEADPWRVQLVNRRWLTVGPSQATLLLGDESARTRHVGSTGLSARRRATGRSHRSDSAATTMLSSGNTR